MTHAIMIVLVKLTVLVFALERWTIRFCSTDWNFVMISRKWSKYFLPRASPIKSAMSSMVLASPIFRRRSRVGSTTFPRHSSTVFWISPSSFTCAGLSDTVLLSDATLEAKVATPAVYGARNASSPASKYPRMPVSMSTAAPRISLATPNTL